jgi:hypothetical protein
MRKISILFLLLLTASVFTGVSNAESDSEFKLKYTFNPETPEKCFLIGFSGTPPATVVIPSYSGVAGREVVGISASLFLNITSIETVVIMDNVRWIGDAAFANCPSLRKVVLPKTLERIESYAFFNCKSLWDIDFSGCIQLELIGENAFMGCDLFGLDCTGQGFYKDIIFPPSLEYLGRNAFSFCQNLGHVYFKGNAPHVPVLSDFPVLYPHITWSNPTEVFGNHFVLVYYLEGTTGWEEARGTWIKETGLYPWTLPANEPEVFIPQKTVKDGKVEMTLVFGGALQSSTNLKDWEPVETASPYLVSVPTTDKKFYRAVSSEAVE